MTGTDPAPVTSAQLRALARSAQRELTGGLRAVSAEVAAWRTRALTIRDPDLRAHALAAIDDKRPLLDGAALFWTIPNDRNPGLLRLLVCFQILANFHDGASERAAHGQPGTAATVQPLVQALDLRLPPPAYYGPGPEAPDGGFLHSLAAAVSTGCATLPAYERARRLLIHQAARARSLDLEHDLDAHRRTTALRRFAADEFGPVPDTAWWELAAGTGSLVTVLVLLALASDSQTSDAHLSGAARAYIWVGSVSALLDNYVDQHEDALSGSHNYLNYYASPAEAAGRLASLVGRATRAVGALPDGERHLVIVACMTAMFLTHANARDPALRAATRTIIGNGGTLTRALVPVLATWRLAYRQPRG